MTQWEHFIGFYRGDTITVPALDELGAQGWMLVSVVFLAHTTDEGPGFLAFWRRPKG